MYEPIERKPVSEAIFDRLRDAILSDALQAGASLASERALSEEFGVNRHAVREALKRLQQAGLVQVSQGGATRVLDWRATGGLDLLAQLPIAHGLPAADLLRAVVELRLCVGVDAARRCAERAPAAVIAVLRDAPAADPVGYARLWEVVIDGADNIAYRLAYNSLLNGVEPGDELSLQLFGDEVGDLAGQRALVDSIAAGDVDGAGVAAAALLQRAIAVALGIRAQVRGHG